MTEVKDYLNNGVIINNMLVSIVSNLPIIGFDIHFTFVGFNIVDLFSNPQLYCLLDPTYSLLECMYACRYVCLLFFQTKTKQRCTNSNAI